MRRKGTMLSAKREEIRNLIKLHASLLPVEEFAAGLNLWNAFG
jgi:hypothetical protein